MGKVLTRPRARMDLAEIWDYIADDSEKNADSFLDQIQETLLTLSAQPLIGHARPELAASLRSFPIGRYIVFYVPLTDGVEIVRVLHSARDVQTQFSADASGSN